MAAKIYRCPWCSEEVVFQPGDLCESCAQEPDAVDFKEAHDKALCPCKAHLN